MKWLLKTLEVVVVAALLCASWGGMLHPAAAPMWLPLMVMAFPLLALLALVLALLAAVQRRWLSVSALVVALLAVVPMLRITAPVHFGGGVSEQRQLTVLTLNAANFEQTAAGPPNVTLEYILGSGADVVLLQEIARDGWGVPYEQRDSTFSPEQRSRLDSIYPYRSHDNDDVGILSRFPYTRIEITRPHVGFDMVDYFATMEHHYAVAYDLHLPDHRQLRVIGVHLQSWNFSRRQRALLGGSVTDELDALPGSAVYGMTTTQLIGDAYAKRAAEAVALRRALDDGPPNVIVCGDFNDVPGSWVYRTVRGGDLRDAWGDAGLGYAHTYHQYHFLLRIDHILYRGALRATSIRRDRATASDHYPQLVTFQWD